MASATGATAKAAMTKVSAANTLAHVILDQNMSA